MRAMGWFAERKASLKKRFLREPGVRYREPVVIYWTSLPRLSAGLGVLFVHTSKIRLFLRKNESFTLTASRRQFLDRVKAESHVWWCQRNSALTPTDFLFCKVTAHGGETPLLISDGKRSHVSVPTPSYGSRRSPLHVRRGQCTRPQHPICRGALLSK